MGLISLCPNARCPLRRACYRWMQRTRPGEMRWHDAPATPRAGEACDSFVALRPGDRLREDGK
jgi:hypothetical protein